MKRFFHRFDPEAHWESVKLGGMAMKKKILVVDDDKPIRELLKFKLSHKGFDVTLAGDEREFWNLAFDAKPDLIILDIWLKNKVGTDIYDSLLNFGFDPNVPVIFITALVRDQKPIQPNNSRKFLLFSKPFDFDKLTDEINRLLEAASNKQNKQWVNKAKAVP